MRDPESEKIVEGLYKARDQAVEIFRENYQEVVETYKKEILQYAHDQKVLILEALYDRLQPKLDGKPPLSQTERMLYSAAAVEILTAPKDQLTN